ncbi:tetratricopeptide repeat protein [Nitrospira moscoviensis]|nr:tetratricopeptide repeat protein [Nitrospira moscoviensis]
MVISYRRVVLGIIVAILFLYARERIEEMDGRLFQASFHGAQGLAYYLTGHYAKAATAYRAHLRDGGWRQWDTGDHAYRALLQGDVATAALAADQQLATQHDDLLALLTRGEVALAQRDFHAALLHFDQILEHDETHADALLLTAVAHTYAQAPNQAIDTLNRLLRSNRVEARLTTFLWTLEAVDELQEGTPDGLRWCLLAHYYRNLRIYDPSNAPLAAKAAYRAIELGGRPDDAYVTLGVLEDKRGDYDRALSFFLQAIDLNSLNAEAFRWAANIYRHRGSDLLNEYQMWKGAVEASPKDQLHRANLIAFLTERFGDYPQALEYVKAGLSESPQNQELLAQAAKLHFNLGRAEEAIGYYRQLLTLQPRNPAFYEAIGMSLETLERYDEAAQTYRMALAIDPARSYAHRGLGNVYANQKRVQESIVEYETAIRLGDNDLTLKTYLCQQYVYTGQYRQAATCLEQVLKRDPDNKGAQHLYPYVRKGLGHDVS